MGKFYIITTPYLKGYGELLRNVDGMLYMAETNSLGERLPGSLLYVDEAYCTEAIPSLDRAFELVEA